jgi:hypothetical protein
MLSVARQLQEIILGRILLVAKPAHEKLMEHSPLYSRGIKAIEQRYLWYTLFKHFSLPPAHRAYIGVAPSADWHACTSSQGPEVVPFLVL